jgi:hypothetical protein
MTVTLSDHPTWPDGDPGKVLLNCMISTSVDEVFEELFGSYPQTQVCVDAKLHGVRSCMVSRPQLVCMSLPYTNLPRQ